MIEKLTLYGLSKTLLVHIFYYLSEVAFLSNLFTSCNHFMLPMYFSSQNHFYSYPFFPSFIVYDAWLFLPKTIFILILFHFIKLNPGNVFTSFFFCVFFVFTFFFLWLFIFLLYYFFFLYLSFQIYFTSYNKSLYLIYYK